MLSIAASSSQEESEETTLPAYKEFLRQKEEFANLKHDFEKHRLMLTEESKKHKERLIDCERLFEVEKSKQNKLFQENLELKHELHKAKKKESMAEQELIDLLKNENSKNIQFFQDYAVKLHPVLQKRSLSSNLKSISELENENFDLKMQLLNEQNNSQNVYKL